MVQHEKNDLLSSIFFSSAKWRFFFFLIRFASIYRFASHSLHFCFCIRFCYCLCSFNIVVPLLLLFLITFNKTTFFFSVCLWERASVCAMSIHVAFMCLSLECKRCYFNWIGKERNGMEKRYAIVNVSIIRPMHTAHTKSLSPILTRCIDVVEMMWKNNIKPWSIDVVYDSWF